jgi:hypothetical protein
LIYHDRLQVIYCLNWSAVTTATDHHINLTIGCVVLKTTTPLAISSSKRTVRPEIHNAHQIRQRGRSMGLYERYAELFF